MNISKQDIDAVNAVISIEIVKEDYADRVDTVLKDYRKKAQAPGFRPGKMPMGIVKKMYGKSVLLEEVNKILGEQLNKYIQDEQINVLGEPLPNEDQELADFENSETFVFKFDVGVSPDFEVAISKRNKIPFYSIIVDDEMIDRQIESHAGRFGTQEGVDSVEADDMVKGNFVQKDEEGNIIENGVAVENAVLSPARITDEAIKAEFIGAEVGKIITFNPRKAFDNDAEVSSLLNIDKEIAADFAAELEYTITEITRFVKAEVNKELFDKIYGEGTCEDEVAFRAKVKEEITAGFADDTEFRFLMDAKDKLIKQMEGVEFPEAFLKRWLTATNTENENFNAEALETEFPQILEGLKWDIVKSQIAKNNEIKLEEADLMGHAKKVALAQFRQYGIPNVPDEHLENYAKEMLQDKEQSRNITDRAFEMKVATTVKELVKVDEKEIALEDFNKLFDTK